MKPIATVHWTHDGKEYTQDYYRFDFLEKQIRNLTENGNMYMLCVTNTQYPLPSSMGDTPHKNISATK